jgi:hypothetical protein
LPHVDAAAIGHCDAGTGGLPAAMFVQVPSVPASAHDLHVAVHVVAQQMFCAQMLLAQSPFAVHVAPLGRGVHTPPEQMLGDWQWASTVQSIRQAPVPQT